MKTWQKLYSSLLIIAAFVAAFHIFFVEQKTCFLCNSFRYHAPCLVDLEAGELIELGLYLPHPTLVAELDDTQPDTNTFSFVRLGNVLGTKLTDSKTIALTIPFSESITDPALCNDCKKQLPAGYSGRYILADLYDSNNKVLFPLTHSIDLTLRCYKITISYSNDTCTVLVQGILDTGATPTNHEGSGAALP